jgi:transposase
MARKFVRPDLDQPLLFPEDMRGWLAEDHLVHVVIEAAAGLDLSAFTAAYRNDGRGRPPIHPEIMAGLLLYAYCVGVRSSRKIEKACAEDVAFRVISRNLLPDHATIAEFRSRHRAAMGTVFTQVLALLAEAGMVRVGLIAVDGTKIGADASLAANKTEDKLTELLDAERELIDLRRTQLAQIADGVIGEAERIDAAEDARFGDRRGDELPAQLARRADRADRLAAARDRLADRQAAARDAAQDAQDAKITAWEQRKADGTARGPRPRDTPPKGRTGKPPRANVTDPDARAMKGRHKRDFIVGYNAQLAVTADQVILAADLNCQPVDQGLLAPTMHTIQRNLAAAGVAAEIPDDLHTVCADAGYASENTFAWAGSQNLRLLCPLAKDTHRTQHTHPDAGRDLSRRPATRTAQQHLATTQGKADYALRGQTIEPVIGHLKTRHNLRRFTLRRHDRCQAELHLAAAAHNLCKLHRNRREQP